MNDHFISRRSFLVAAGMAGAAAALTACGGPSALTSTLPAPSRPRSKRARIAICSSLPVKSR